MSRLLVAFDDSTAHRSAHRLRSVSDIRRRRHLVCMGRLRAYDGLCPPSLFLTGSCFLVCRPVSKVGDAIIAINGTSVQGVSFSDIMLRLKTCLQEEPMLVVRFRTMEERYRLLRMKARLPFPLHFTESFCVRCAVSRY